MKAADADKRVLERVKAKPGIAAKAIPVNQRSALRRLELAGLIEYRNDGWHPTTRRQNHDRHSSPTQDIPEPSFPSTQQFDTLTQGRAWIESLVTAGVDFRTNRIYNDWFKKPRSRLIKVLGVEARAQRECQRIAPGGKWTVETYGETHDDLYFTAQAWYTKFAPYALAMCQSEEGYQCFGIDYESINSLLRHGDGVRQHGHRHV